MNKSDSLHFSSYNPDYVYFYPALKLVIYYRIRDSDSEAYIDVIILCNLSAAIIFIKFSCMGNLKNRYSGKAINNKVSKERNLVSCVVDIICLALNHCFGSYKCVSGSTASLCSLPIESAPKLSPRHSDK